MIQVQVQGHDSKVESKEMKRSAQRVMYDEEGDDNDDGDGHAGVRPPTGPSFRYDRAWRKLCPDYSLLHKALRKLISAFSAVGVELIFYLRVNDWEHKSALNLLCQRKVTHDLSLISAC